MVASRLCVPLTAVLFTLGKLLYAHSQFDVELLASAFWKSTTIVVLLLLFSWTPALKPLRGNLLTILLSITASLVFLGDLLYYRLYQDWPSLSSLPAAPQLTTAGRSMLESLQLSDLWLFADLPVLLLLSFKVQSPERPPGKRYRLVPLTGPAVLCLGFISMLALFAWNPGLVHSRMRNSDYVIYQGLVLFHAFDVLTCTTTRLGVLPTLPQEEILPLFKARRHSVGEHIRFFGAHRGSNVLMVQLESFESFPLNLVVHGQEVTPFLNRLAEESLWAAAHDQTLDGSSSDGCFMYVNGIHPPEFGPVVFQFAGNRYHALPTILKQLGYSTHTATPFESSFWNILVMDKAYGYETALYDDAFVVTPETRMDWGIRDQPLF